MKFRFLMRMKNISPFLLFLPFFLFYIAIILIFHNNQLANDEIRYLGYAKNLVNGFYSPPPPNVSIINGPGYPIILMPFVAVNAPVLLIVLLNALFYYLSVVFLFKTLRHFASFNIALVFSLFWACYYNSYQDMLFAFTESFTCLLISLIAYFLTRAFNDAGVPEKRKYTYLAGIAIGYLILTKIIFGYVLLFMLLGSGLLWIFNRRCLTFKKNMGILLIAFVTILPYLLYTYYLTGKIFYLGNAGADSLYWMSTPHKLEFGDWQGYPGYQGFDPYRVRDSWDSLEAHHKKDFDSIRQLHGAEQDDMFTSIAVKNIKEHPVKFVQNCISNLGRLLFSFPNSYTLQNNKTLLRLPLNGIILVLSFFCIIPTLWNWKRINFSIRFLLFFVCIYLGGSVLASGLTRMFTVIAPVFLLWIAFILQKTVIINLKFNKD